MCDEARIPRLMTIPHLARRLGISRWAAERMLRTQGIKFVLSGRRRLVPISEIAEKLPEVVASDRLAKLFERIQRAQTA